MNFRRWQRKLSREKTKITFIHIYSLRLPEQKIIETIKKFWGKTNISVAAAQDRLALCCCCYCSWSVMYLMFRREHNSTSFYARNTKNCTICRKISHFFRKTSGIFIQFHCRHLQTPPQLEKSVIEAISLLSRLQFLLLRTISQNAPLFIPLSIWLHSYHDGGV